MSKIALTDVMKLRHEIETIRRSSGMCIMISTSLTDTKIPKKGETPNPSDEELESIHHNLLRLKDDVNKIITNNAGNTTDEFETIEVEVPMWVM